VAGFRIDVCNVIIKDAELRDNPPSDETDPFDVQLFGQKPVYNQNRPEVHDVIRRWRTLVDAYPDSMLVGETPVPEFDALARFYGSGHDELHLAFNFPFINAPLEADAMRSIVEDTEAALPPEGWPVWTGSNHDMSRFATRWAGGDPAKARLAMVMLLTLRGTPVLYMGDEIGQEDVDVPHDKMRDPLGVAYFPVYNGRDAMRTPMQWKDQPGGGFTDPGVEPWLPLGDTAAHNVEAQLGDPDSMLTLARDLIALRRETDALRSGPYRSLTSPAGTWVWARGDRHVVAANLSDGDAVLDGITGTVLLGTDRGRDGTPVTGSLPLRRWEAVVVERA
jgi:alpha-glucosidase